MRLAKLTGYMKLTCPILLLIMDSFDLSSVVSTDLAPIIIAQEAKKVVDKFRLKYFLRSCIILKVLKPQTKVRDIKWARFYPIHL